LQDGACFPYLLPTYRRFIENIPYKIILGSRPRIIGFRPSASIWHNASRARRVMQRAIRSTEHPPHSGLDSRRHTAIDDAISHIHSMIPDSLIAQLCHASVRRTRHYTASDDFSRSLLCSADTMVPLDDILPLFPLASTTHLTSSLHYGF
jgi:hypothetical protein